MTHLWNNYVTNAISELLNYCVSSLCLRKLRASELACGITFCVYYKYDMIMKFKVWYYLWPVVLLLCHTESYYIRFQVSYFLKLLFDQIAKELRPNSKIRPTNQSDIY